ncbi:MAG: hypothetical protein A2987_01270 [Omnitrophica bacterium RIFCSPLOWO2_01_FULL_45_10]|nr:MAG: hypothetical protein A2987_01270 [Omnitrophica bacterium RIFCSPLOWO2_01_FULL_45_10]
MKKLLHVIATPRGDESRTLKVTEAFLDVFKSRFPDWSIDELNLHKEKLPPLTLKRVDGKYALLGGKELSGEFKEAWQEIIVHIERFRSADLYLISTPMWNFTIPYTLKHYIDIIVQPKYLFRYTGAGVEGLLKGKKMVVIASRGGDYTGDGSKFDYQEPYLRAIFGFCGIEDITFVVGQPMEMGQELQSKKLEEAKASARSAARGLRLG